jgi:hypothetical protein
METLPEATNNIKDLKTILNVSYEDNFKAKETLEDKGYIFDEDLSNEKQKVFYDPVTDTPKIVFKGTTDMNEWLRNPLIPLSLEFLDPEFQESKELVKQVTEKYKSKPDLYGHSRGASKGVYNAGLANQVYTYNKPSKLYGSYIFNDTPDNVHNYRATFDPVSALDVLKSKNLGGSILPLKAHSTQIKFI